MSPFKFIYVIYKLRLKNGLNGTEIGVRFILRANQSRFPGQNPALLPDGREQFPSIHA
jgi:hypothetical protein